MEWMGSILSVALPFWAAKAAFIAPFAVLIVILAALPPNRIGQTERKPPAWRNVRYWAILIAAVQIAVYARWG